MKANPDVIALLLELGVPIHMQFRDGKREWWMEHKDQPRVDIPDHVVMNLLTTGKVTEAGDSLFGLPNNSQTFRGKDDV